MPEQGRLHREPAEPSRLDEPADSVLIARSLDEPDAFAPLYDRHAGAIHDFVSRRLGNDLADDLCAQTFYVAFDRRRSYDLARPHARPWLYGIVTNLLHRHRRQEVRGYRAIARATGSAQVEAYGEIERIVNRVAAAESVRSIAAALAALSMGERDVLLLHAWGDLSHDEIAAALTISSGTARARLHRARKRLRPLLEEHDERLPRRRGA